MVEEAAGLVSLTQMNTLELHSWGSSTDDIERPDRLVFDLDPGEQVGWSEMVQAAERVREILDGMKLQSFVKTTGGKGLHVVSPLKPRATWDEAKAFSLAIARFMAQRWPGEYIATVSKAQRKGKVFVDYLRNQRGATSVAAYSTRAREGATVSMPVRWADLPKLKPGAFTAQTVPRHLRQRTSDPWKGYQGAKGSMPPASAAPTS